jgi:hypothetical protein
VPLLRAPGAEKKHINHHFEDAEESDCNGEPQNSSIRRYKKKNEKVL